MGGAIGLPPLLAKVSVPPSARFSTISHAQISAVLYAFFRAIFVINPLQKQKHVVACGRQ